MSFRTAINIALSTMTRRLRKIAKAAIYIRVSTVMQLDKESRGVQRNDLIRYCNDILGIPVYEIFEDAGFFAGTTDRIIRKCCSAYGPVNSPTCLYEKLTESAGTSLISPICIRSYGRAERFKAVLLSKAESGEYTGFESPLTIAGIRIPRSILSKNQRLILFA